MVTVPALGPEWKTSELRELSGKVSKEERRERMALKWKEWRRGERGLCGRYFTKKFLAWFLFALCVAYVDFVLVLSCHSDEGLQYRLGPCIHNPPSPRFPGQLRYTAHFSDLTFQHYRTYHLLSSASKLQLPCIRGSSAGHWFQLPPPELPQHSRDGLRFADWKASRHGGLGTLQRSCESLPQNSTAIKFHLRFIKQFRPDM